MAAFQKLIDRAANQFRHRQAGPVGQLAQGVVLRLRQVVIDPSHTSIIHTRRGKSTVIGLLLAALSAGAFGQEIAVPDKPVVATVTSYRIIAFAFAREPDWRFTITFQDSTGRVVTDEHAGPSTVPNPNGGAPLVNPDGAETFLRQMNTANFSVNSLTKRLLQHLVAHGKIPAATVTGTPEAVGQP